MEKRVKEYQLLDIANRETKIAGYFDTMRDLKNFAVGYRVGKRNCKLIVQKWSDRKERYTLECALIK